MTICVHVHMCFVIQQVNTLIIIVQCDATPQLCSPFICRAAYGSHDQFKYNTEGRFSRGGKGGALPPESKVVMKTS